MVISLKTAFSRLEMQLDNLLQIVKVLTYNQQNFKPEPGSWSILQVFRHMMQSEGQILKYLQKKILGTANVQKASVGAMLRSALLNTALRLPVKYKVPKVIMVEFDENYDFEKLSTDWKLLRKEIENFLENIDEATSQKEIFRHPVVGRMSLLQGMAFMHEHLERHSKQIERIMRHRDFPE
jgi:hypothetical protein